MTQKTNYLTRRLAFWGCGALAGGAFMALLAGPVNAATNVPVNWSVDMSFFFNNEAAPGQVSQDPLALTLGASTSSGTTKLKPPLPPGLAKTNNAGYPLIDAYVTEAGNRVFNKTGQSDVEGRSAYTVKVTAEQAGADVSLTIDCSTLDPAITLNLVHGRTLKRQKVTKSLCTGPNTTMTLTDFFEVLDPAIAEEVFVVAAPDGGVFVAKNAQGTVIGALTTDNLGGSFDGVSLTIGGQTVNVGVDGTFSAGAVAGLQEVVISRKGHLRRRLNLNVDGGQPLAIPKLAGGDANSDNKIDLKDLGVLKQQFNGDNACYADLQSTASCGDANGDGKVDLKDLGVLKQNYNLNGDA